MKNTSFLGLLVSLSPYGVWIVAKDTRMRVIASCENDTPVCQVVGRHGEGLLYQGSDAKRIKEIFENRFHEFSGK